MGGEAAGGRAWVGGRMPTMNGNAYKLLGHFVWRAGKWYLRRRLPSAPMLAAGTVALLTGGVAAVLIARRILA